MPPEDTAQHHEEHVGRGMLAALAAFFVFTIMNVFAKLLAARHSVIEIAFYRNLVACMPFLFMAFVLGKRDMLVIRSQPRALVLRAVVGAISLTTTFAAFALMPMAETTVLLFTASLFVPVMGVLFLKEHVGPWRWGAVVAGFLGVAIMAGPTGNLNVLGVTVALAAALLHAMLAILLRFLGKHERPETVTFYFLVIGLLVTAVPMPFVAVRPSLDELPMIIGIGLCGAAAQWLLSTAYRNASAATVTVFNYTGIVWATLFGVLIWSEWPTGIVVAGAAIIISSNALVVWRENRLGRIGSARIRAKL